MNNIKTSNFTQVLKNINAGLGLNRIEIDRHRLVTDSIYAYCPYCVRKVKKEKGEDWKNGLEKMWQVTYGEFVVFDETRAIASKDTGWVCDTCHREITTDDFLAIYCSKKEPKSKVIDLTKCNINDPNFAMQYWFGR